PYRDLSDEAKRWVLEGEEGWQSWEKSWPALWYGVRHYFKWLEGKAYKMHIRVLLSKYRAYTPCTACNGARLKTENLLWRLGSYENAERALRRAAATCACGGQPCECGHDYNDAAVSSRHSGQAARPRDPESRDGTGRFKPAGVEWTDAQLDALPGLSVPDLTLLPISRVRDLFANLHSNGDLDPATDPQLQDIRT